MNIALKKYIPFPVSPPEIMYAFSKGGGDTAPEVVYAIASVPPAIDNFPNNKTRLSGGFCNIKIKRKLQLTDFLHQIDQLV